MEKLTLAEAKRLNDTMVTEEHLKLHAANVSACMGAMAEHFGADKEFTDRTPLATLNSRYGLTCEAVTARIRSVLR